MRSLSHHSPDRAVDRDEIIAAVWHDVAVTDDSLIHAVSVIRRALGDDPAHASFIETIPRRGYRFVGHVETVEASRTRERSLGGPTARRRARRTAHRSLAMAHGHDCRGRRCRGRWRDRLRTPRVTGGTSPSAVRLEQIAPPGTTIVSGGVVSPTGRQLAFVARDEVTERTALWIRALGRKTRARMLPGTDGAAQPSFHPTDRQIAFFRTGELVATDLGGGQLRTIATVQGAPAGGSWGAGGVIVFAEWMTGLYAVSRQVVRLAVTRLDHTALDVAHAWPQFLPDGSISCIRWSVPTAREPAYTSRASMGE